LPDRRSEAGYSLVALLAAVTVMLVAMGAAVPAWKYVMKNEREEELIFRGGQIADAIVRYQRRHGNAYPPSLEVLVERKFLRKLSKDPMTKEGRWRLVRPGEAVGAPGGPGAPPVTLPGGASPPPTTQPAGPGAPTGTSFGLVMGVVSTSAEKGLRVFNGRTRYNEWAFVAGQPRVVGRPATIGGLGPPRPSPGPTPLRTQPR
jgi:type II secretory pathway pseudopilin PulG